MAGAAWQRGTTTLSDGSRAVHADAGNVLRGGDSACSSSGRGRTLLMPVRRSFSRCFAFYLFTLYTIAAAVVGNRSGMDALRESFAIARARFGTTLIIGVVLAVCCSSSAD